MYRVDNPQCQFKLRIQSDWDGIVGGFKSTMSCATAASSEKRVSRVRTGVNQMTRYSNSGNEEYHPASQVIYLHGRGLDNEPLFLRQFALLWKPIIPKSLAIFGISSIAS
jgi:hypothetical protein